MKPKLSLTLILGLVVGTTFLTGCSTVPVTGRSQLRLVSAEQEMQLGLTSFEQMKKEMKISNDPAANALVQKVGKRIAAAAGQDLPNAQWEFIVFENPEPNAFCLPGGKIGIHTGILPITKDEAGLATVMGHEVAHAAAHHGSERISQSMVLQGLGEVVASSVSGLDPKVQAATALAYGVGTQVGVILPFSRKDESEADEIGLIYMARAGYNPEASLDFWRRFASVTAGDGGPPAFLRTHPGTDVRIEQLQKLMPRAKAEYNNRRDRISN